MEEKDQASIRNKGSAQVILQHLLRDVPREAKHEAIQSQVEEFCCCLQAEGDLVLGVRPLAQLKADE